MKKILSFFVVVTIVAFIACDSNNNPADTEVIALRINVNGVPLNFTTVKVESEDVVPTNGNPPYTDLIVTATISNDPTKRVLFRLAKNETGTETCYYFAYTGDIDPSDPDDIGTDYQYVRRFDRDKFSINILENSANNLKGTFSGKLLNFKSEAITISNGSFDIKY